MTARFQRRQGLGPPLTQQSTAHALRYQLIAFGAYLVENKVFQLRLCASNFYFFPTLGCKKDVSYKSTYPCTSTHNLGVKISLVNAGRKSHVKVGGSINNRVGARIISHVRRTCSRISFQSICSRMNCCVVMKIKPIWI